MANKMYITVTDIDISDIRNGEEIIFNDNNDGHIILRPEHDEKYNKQKQLILSYADSIEDPYEVIKFLEKQLL